MKTLPPSVKQLLETAPNKALATYSDQNGINAVPVSVVKFSNELEIVLINFFMGKTIDNIIENNSVSLVAWDDMEGYQIKGTCDYIINGDLFSEITEWAGVTFPDRSVNGLIRIKPKEIYNVSPLNNPGERIW